MEIIKRPAMWMLPRRPKRVSFLNLAIFTALVCSLYIFRLPHLPLVHQDVEVDEFQGSDPPPRMVEFWKDLAEALSRAEPNATEIRAKHDLPRIDFDPFGGAPKLGIDQIKKIPEDQLESLKQTHADFIESIRRLAPNMPFKPGSRGIVMTADSAYLGVAITSLLMLRRTGSKLPVELFLDSTNDHTRQVCDQTLSALNAKCFNMDDFFRLPDNSTTIPKLEKYQFKVFALLFSSFQDIMFLDADAFPVHMPDHLLQVEPFKSHGLVTWPDFWLPTVSPLFYYIVGAAPPEVTLESRSTESGIMLYNKEKHADSLLLATYYNLYGPKLYYPLHSQNAWGQGDKETFRLSAMVLDKPIWHVQIPPEMMTDEHINEGSGIRQVDPEQDWQAHLQAQELAVKLQNGDLSGLEEEEKVKPPRWMFAHTNRVKIDARRLSETVGKIIYKKEEDKYSRLWGSDSSTLIDAAGYDLEKAIWEEIIKADCEKSFLEECEKIREYYESVFVS